MTLFGGSGSNDSLTASNVTNVTLFGGSGSNDSLTATIARTSPSSGGSGGNETLTASGGNGVTLINGGNGLDYLTCNGGTNVNLFGGGGADVLTANGGTNVGLYGEDGNNTFNITGTAANPFSGFLDDLATSGLEQSPNDLNTAGTNTIAFPTAAKINIDLSQTSCGASSQIIPQTVADHISLYLVGMFENVIGTPGDDFIQGNAIDNSLTGGAGNDTLVAGSGRRHSRRRPRH